MTEPPYSSFSGTTQLHDSHAIPQTDEPDLSVQVTELEAGEMRAALLMLATRVSENPNVHLSEALPDVVGSLLALRPTVEVLPRPIAPAEIQDGDVVDAGGREYRAERGHFHQLVLTPVDDVAVTYTPDHVASRGPLTLVSRGGVR